MPRPRRHPAVPKKKVKLDVNDALRIATTDPRFASALMNKPEDFKTIFGLKDVEIKALKDFPTRVTPGGPGRIPGPGGGRAMEYDA